MTVLYKHAEYYIRYILTKFTVSPNFDLVTTNTSRLQYIAETKRFPLIGLY